MGADDRDPLGTLGSWVVDAAIAGTLFPAVSLGLVLAWDVATGFGPTSLHQVAWVVVLAIGLGGALGLVLAPIIRWAAEQAWRVGPVLAFAVGPAAGAVAAVLVVGGIGLGMGAPVGLDGTTLPLFLGFGAVAIGPPWVAYLAVRASGRRGTAVAAAATFWMVVPVAILIAVEELSRL